MVRIGVLSMAHVHAPSYAQCVESLPECELAGIADEEPERGGKAAERYHTRYFDSFEALCAADIDAVIIAGDNAGHLPLTLLAARHGRHVLCEKPIARTVEEARQMVDACEKAGVILATAFPCRFIPAMREIKRMIDDGQIGPIRAIRGTNHGYMPGGWFIDLPRSGGGAVIDHTVHVADLMRWFLSSDANEVYAEVDTLFYDVPADDTGMLSFSFSNGVFATLDTSWSRPKSFATWGDVTMKLVLDNGTVEVDAFNQKIDFYSNANGKANWLYFGDDMDRAMVANFVAAVAGSEKVSATGLDGLKALEVAIGAYRSAESGEPVALPLS